MTARRLLFGAGVATLCVWVLLPVYLVALGAFFVYGEYTRKARVTGVLAPIQGVVRIVALQPGMVVAAFAREGETVESEAALFLISDTRANRTTEDFGSAYAARLETRRRALERQRRGRG